MKSQSELLKNRIVRITNEAFDQGAYLTQADLSIILGESIKTICRHCQQLKEEGIIVPTRGNRMDIGPGISHKTKIVEMYLNGYEFTDIKRNTRHSSESIMRYLNEFARCALLCEENYSLNQIRVITEHSERLIGEYLDLYSRMKDNEECKDRINELLNKVRGKKWYASSSGVVSRMSERCIGLTKEEKYAMIKAKIHRTLKEDIKELIERDYSMIAGNKVRNMFADDVLKIIEKRYEECRNIETGQVLWFAVDKNEKWSYGKNAKNTRLVPVKLTLISMEDIDMLSSGCSLREVRERRIVRLFKEAYEQEGLLSNNDVAMLLNISPTTVSKHLREYMVREKEIVPTRGIVHDLGRAITHKRIIVWLYNEGYLTPEIARKTGHSEEACDRYIRTFNKVKMLSKKGLDRLEISKILGISPYLVGEYLSLIKEFSGGDAE